MVYTNQIKKIKNKFFCSNPTLSKRPLVGVEGPKLKHFFSRHPEVIFFSLIFLTTLMVLVSKTKKIEDESCLEIFLGQPEKLVFWRIFEN